MINNRKIWHWVSMACSSLFFWTGLFSLVNEGKVERQDFLGEGNYCAIVRGGHFSERFKNYDSAKKLTLNIEPESIGTTPIYHGTTATTSSGDSVGMIGISAS